MKVMPSSRLSLDHIQRELTESVQQSERTPDSDKSEALEEFQKLLSDSIGTVNDLQHQADSIGKKAALGELEDVSTAIVAMEKAQLALDMTVEVRNKLIEAYKEVMRMPI
jgi:flagellar hook-basal body complex protein FliE